jgi:hypothetical protein
MAFAAGAAHSLTQVVWVWIAMAWMYLVAALIVSGVLRVRAGSHWEERWCQSTDWKPRVCLSRLPPWLGQSIARFQDQP